jgi:hypothetical protein
MEFNSGFKGLIWYQGNRCGGVELNNLAEGWDRLWFLVNAVMEVPIMHNVKLQSS